MGDAAEPQSLGWNTPSRYHVQPICVQFGFKQGPRLRYALGMADDKLKGRSPTGRLYREISYLHEDESRALAEAAIKLRCSKSEVIRRAVRAFLSIED